MPSRTCGSRAKIKNSAHQKGPCDLLNILATIAEKKAEFRSLSDTWADTTTCTAA